MTNDDETMEPALAAAWERAALAARWMLRNGPPTPEHYRAVMDALAATELADAQTLSANTANATELAA